MINENFLFVKILKVRYYFDCSFFDVLLGSRLSFIWRSVWSVRWVMEKGCRWLIGDGEFVNVWKDKWLLREIIFKLFIFVRMEIVYLKVGDFIDKEVGCWR